MFSDSVNFKTISFAECGIPKAINATNISLNSAQITWSLISTAEGYHVSYRKTGESDWKQVFVSSNEVNLINLTADTDYEVQVASSCSGTIGEFSDAVNFKTKSLGVCGVPKRVTVYHIGANTASATWANVSGASSYNINYRMIGSGAQSNWSNVTAYTNSVVLSGLAADKEYEVRISTVCDETSSSDYTTPVGFKTLLVGTGCQSPEAININTITSTTANVNWEAVAASTGGYVLLYKRTAANTWWEDMATSSNNAALSGLRPGTDYQVKIASICDGRLGEFSNPVDFSTLNNIDSVTANHAKEIKLYPNPAIDILNVNNISDNAIYKIYNSTGKMINSGNITQNKINVSQLSQGIYIIMIEQGKDIFRSQFIKK
ncbi:fibronectin type III domain-containing protein [Chryseobacterium limigenitum]|uniref:Por secretion system C-terminal sorting domain-containing protein n=1 Tax=Chryseobacterium limigenitum TaxID=1612149 RepID=A0A1K2IEJ3_9FLAO|nr:fibronectin type III domain-containing protein [Chryseobacterium limigenitum]SFZ90860.1 Por secretion system C-terminal sorting domain-containing protein [Chryseobacterium limigenitum]